MTKSHRDFSLRVEMTKSHRDFSPRVEMTKNINRGKKKQPFGFKFNIPDSFLSRDAIRYVIFPNAQCPISYNLINMLADSLEQLRQQLAEFAAVRKWDQFHSPKNLAMALIAETAELVEHFQWVSETNSYLMSPDKKQAVSFELADVLIYLTRIADKLDIDLIAAAQAKIKINETRYPVEKVKGDARRASEYL